MEDAAAAVHPPSLLQAIWEGTPRRDPNDRGKATPRRTQEGDQTRNQTAYRQNETTNPIESVPAPS